MSQRTLMTELVAKLGCDKDKVCAAYAKAENLGQVPRDSNQNNLSAQQYAEELYADGIRKGWIQC